MKARFLKLFMLPLAAFALASAAAVNTDHSKDSAVESTTMWAYVHVPNIGDCLSVEVECEPGIGLPCKDAFGRDAFGEDTPSTCNLDLKRI